MTFTPTVTGTRTGKLSVSDSASNSPQTAGADGHGRGTRDADASHSHLRGAGGRHDQRGEDVYPDQQPDRGPTSIAISTTGDFAISATTCTTSLAAKGKCTISVTFTPTVTGTRTGKLSVSDSASNSPQKSSLTGTGK